MSQNQISTERKKTIYKLNSVKLEKETNENVEHSLELLNLLVDHIRASFIASRESSVALTKIDEVALWLFTAAIQHDYNMLLEKQAQAKAADVSPVKEAEEWEE